MTAAYDSINETKEMYQPPLSVELDTALLRMDRDGRNKDALNKHTRAAIKGTRGPEALESFVMLYLAERIHGGCFGNLFCTN
ncbi:jg19086 [Pararge aegeria aegeria]|uniref:Jg19086 protein n=1 Tax=Pararge aegeria aegeria TaxID=348720 RepID=A0A8S4SQ96_9NEOP|nr:jg19086 [Pararge aegeria aegeria]